MNNGRSLARHLKRFDLPLAFVEWATLTQYLATWRQRVTQPPCAIASRS